MGKRRQMHEEEIQQQLKVKKHVSVTEGKQPTG